MVKFHKGGGEKVYIGDYPNLGVLKNRVFNAINESIGELDIEGEMEVSGVFVYGSSARGEATKGESDIDILTILDAPQELDELQRDGIEANLTLGLSDRGDDMMAGLLDWFVDVDFSVEILSREDKVNIKGEMRTMGSREKPERYMAFYSLNRRRATPQFNAGVYDLSDNTFVSFQEIWEELDSTERDIVSSFVNYNIDKILRQ